MHIVDMVDANVGYLLLFLTHVSMIVLSTQRNGCSNSRLGPDADGLRGFVSSTFFRSVRFAPDTGGLNHATPLPRGQTEPTKAADLDMYNEKNDDTSDDDDDYKNDDTGRTQRV